MSEAERSAEPVSEAATIRAQLRLVRADRLGVAAPACKQCGEAHPYLSTSFHLDGEPVVGTVFLPEDDIECGVPVAVGEDFTIWADHERVQIPAEVGVVAVRVFPTGWRRVDV